jgi:hypothetical protein
MRDMLAARRGTTGSARSVRNSPADRRSAADAVPAPRGNAPHGLGAALTGGQQPPGQFGHAIGQRGTAGQVRRLQVLRRDASGLGIGGVDGLVGNMRGQLKSVPGLTEAHRAAQLRAVGIRRSVPAVHERDHSRPGLWSADEPHLDQMATTPRKDISFRNIAGRLSSMFRLPSRQQWLEGVKGLAVGSFVPFVAAAEPQLKILSSLGPSFRRGPSFGRGPSFRPSSPASSLACHRGRSRSPHGRARGWLGRGSGHRRFLRRLRHWS